MGWVRVFAVVKLCDDLPSFTFRKGFKMNLSKTLFFASLFTFASFTQAATVDITPSADGDVKTFGGHVVNTTDSAITVVQSGGNITNGILEFDLSSISDTAVINSASLSVTLTQFVSNTGNNPAKVDVFAFIGDGTVDTHDYWRLATKVVNTTTPTGGSAGDKLSFDFEDLALVNAALSPNLLTLRFETDSFATIKFASIENDIYEAATLSVDYTDVSAVPVPAAAILFAPTMLGLVAFRKSSRKA
jgi:hypothetical protein